MTVAAALNNRSLLGDRSNSGAGRDHVTPRKTGVSARVGAWVGGAGVAQRGVSAQV
jgi:hypothetical protein